MFRVDQIPPGSILHSFAAFVVSLLLPLACERQLPATPEARIEASTTAAWSNDAKKVALLASKAGCGHANCRILVTNCITNEGSTSRYGIQISDQLSAALTALLSSNQVVSRDALKSFLEEQRIPSKLFTEAAAARWLGKKLEATTVVVPTLISNSPESQITVEFFEVRFDSKKILVSDEMSVPLAVPSARDLEPSESVEPAPPRTVTASGEPIYRADGKNSRIVLPRCTHTPQPPYTDSARAAKASGSLVIDGIIPKEGGILDLRVTRGLPWELNESALKTIKTWRCGPALLDGKPVTVEVPFEVTFRLF